MDRDYIPVSMAAKLFEMPVMWTHREQRIQVWIMQEELRLGIHIWELITYDIFKATDLDGITGKSICGK